MNDPPDRIFILVLEPDQGLQKKLSADIKAAELDGALITAASPQEATKVLTRGVTKLCFVSSGLGFEVQRDFVTRSLRDSATKNCAFIVVAATTDRDALIKYLKIGAHAVLLYPVELDSIRRVVAAALHALNEQLAGGPSLREQVTNLPWLLESVAKRLDEIAQQMALEQGQTTQQSLSPRDIQAALLLAFANGNKKELS